MMRQSPNQVAAAYMKKWENTWNLEGAATAATLYTPDAVLIGAAIGIGQPEIARLLDRLVQQGWTKISIKVVNAREVGGTVLVASEFSASGSGPNAGKTLNGRSSHVLTQVEGTWLSAMHSAA